MQSEEQRAKKREYNRRYWEKRKGDAARMEKKRQHDRARRVLPEVREKNRLNWKKRYYGDGGKSRALAKERAKKYHRKPDAKVLSRRWHRENKYGCTHKELLQMLTEQGNGCAACHAPITEETLHVDHCHSTGRIRGLLCRACNLSLGQGHDDLQRMRSLVVYLEGFEGRE